MRGRGESIVLTGFMGAGKTTVGRCLARRLGWPFVDLDRTIERAAGMSINALFRKRGERTFRAMETAAIRRLGGRPRVIAAGGGAPVAARNRALLRKAGLVVYLKSPVSVLVRRLRRAANRPVLRSARGRRGALRSLVVRLLRSRERHYARADMIVRAGTGRAEKVAGRIARAAARRGWGRAL